MQTRACAKCVHKAKIVVHTEGPTENVLYTSPVRRAFVLVSLCGAWCVPRGVYSGYSGVSNSVQCFSYPVLLSCVHFLASFQYDFQASLSRRFVSGSLRKSPSLSSLPPPSSSAHIFSCGQFAEHCGNPIRNPASPCKYITLFPENGSGS